MIGIPEEVLREFELPDDSGYEKITNGYNSATWVGHEFVIQAVHSQSLEHHESVLRITEELRRTGAFPGLGFQKRPVVAEGAWWRISKRLDGPVANTLEPETHRLQILEDNLHSLLDDLNLLAGIDIGHMPEPSMSQNISGGELYHWLKANRKEELTSLLQNLSEEPRSKHVVAHGDALLKNMILSPKGVVIIDWESCQIMPRLYDPAHTVVQLLIGSSWGPPSQEEILWGLRLLKEASSYVGSSLNDREVTSLLAHALIREAYLNPNDPKKLPKSTEILQFLVSELS